MITTIAVWRATGVRVSPFRRVNRQFVIVAQGVAAHFVWVNLRCLHNRPGDVSTFEYQWKVSDS